MIPMLFITFFVLMILGVPIAICLGMASMATIAFTMHVPLIVAVQTMYQGINSYQMLAVPFFILAGNLMTQGGLSRRLVDFLSLFFTRVRGGLANVAIVASMFFAAISGSNAATTAAISGIMVPEMKEKGYDSDFTAATVAAGGCVGQVIPPSIPMVTFCVIANTSVSTMFLTGIIPGIMMSVGMIAYAAHFCSKHNIPINKEPLDIKEVVKTFFDCLWALITPIIILGGIYSGLFTATEAGAVACVYAACAAFFIYRELRLKDLPKIFIDTVISSAVIMLIMGCVSTFGYVLSMGHIPQIISERLLAITTNKAILLLLLNLVFIVAGMFMNPSAAIALLTPLLFPTMVAAGINPYLVGIIIVVNLGIGSITPPVGNNLYIASDVAKVPFAQLIRAIIPYIIMLAVVLFLVTYVEPISMWLPRITGASLG